jgi:GNAT superfamily N-acetyltransferase
MVTGWGAAWYRLFSDSERGYGFIDANTPEVSMAVVPSYRRQGVGRALLASLLVQAHLDDFLAVSLSVEEDNPARSLYERLGFESIAHSDNALTMMNRFSLR